MSKLHSRLAQTWLNIQNSLFPWITEELGEITQKQQELVTTLELIRIEERGGPHHLDNKSRIISVLLSP